MQGRHLGRRQHPLAHHPAGRGHRQHEDLVVPVLHVLVERHVKVLEPHLAHGRLPRELRRASLRVALLEDAELLQVRVEEPVGERPAEAIVARELAVALRIQRDVVPRESIREAHGTVLIVEPERLQIRHSKRRRATIRGELEGLEELRHAFVEPARLADVDAGGERVGHLVLQYRGVALHRERAPLLPSGGRAPQDDALRVLGPRVEAENPARKIVLELEPVREDGHLRGRRLRSVRARSKDGNQRRPGLLEIGRGGPGIGGGQVGAHREVRARDLPPAAAPRRQDPARSRTAQRNAEPQKGCARGSGEAHVAASSFSGLVICSGALTPNTPRPLRTTVCSA